MSELLKINVNDHTEKKNGLTYLSWAWAWAEVLKLDPRATWAAHEWGGMPAMFLPDGSAMVKVSVTIKGDTKWCSLPVMDHRNKAIKQPDAFAVNTATMRCLAKAIAMHGLGLYIYAGEDLPEEEKQEKPAQSGSPAALSAASVDIDDARKSELEEIAIFMIESHREGQDLPAIRQWNELSGNDEKVYVWHQLRAESKLRAIIKANSEKKAA